MRSAAGMTEHPATSPLAKQWGLPQIASVREMDPAGRSMRVRGTRAGRALVVAESKFRGEVKERVKAAASSYLRKAQEDSELQETRNIRLATLVQLSNSVEIRTGRADISARSMYGIEFGDMQVEGDMIDPILLDVWLLPGGIISCSFRSHGQKLEAFGSRHVQSQLR